MERVKKGEMYWFIFRTKGGGFVVNCKIEEGSSDDNARFDIGNYFIVKEEALSMARKLRAVLNGADVIEMPSEDEEDREISKQMEMTSYRGEEEDIYTNGFLGCIYWLKSKMII